MGIGDEAGKTITSLADTMKGTPVMLGFLILVGAFLTFQWFDRSRGEAREQAQLELITKLITDCRQGARP